MKISIPKVIVPVEMSEYAPELEGKVLQVWVNPPMDVLGEHLQMAEAMKNGEIKTSDNLLRWYTGLWSQGAAETHWTLDEVREVERDDPAFLNWMISATWQARKAHMDRKKKV